MKPDDRGLFTLCQNGIHVYRCMPQYSLTYQLFLSPKTCSSDVTLCTSFEQNDRSQNRHVTYKLCNTETLASN